jgi:glycosyltransferase involved in cell wall biosynthesis
MSRPCWDREDSRSGSSTSPPRCPRRNSKTTFWFNPTLSVFTAKRPNSLHPDYPGTERSDPLRFAMGFWSASRSHGPYDVVHSHVHYFSGFVLALAALAGVPVRVAHAHNDTSKWNASRSRACYAWLSCTLISAFATHGFGVTEPCARDLFGREFDKDPRWRVLPAGISLVPSRMTWNRAPVAAELGIAPAQFTIAQIGRLTNTKNQVFSLQILASLEIANAVFLLVGEGEMEGRLRQLAHELRVSHRVIFAGPRSDIPRILCAVAEVFILPYSI